MRACLLVCAALALAACRPRAAAASHATHAEPARLEHIKTQILAKLGLTSRPTPLGTPPRDVVRQILARADTHPEPAAPQEQSMREIIAIAHRGDVDDKETGLEYDTIYLDELNVLFKTGDRSNVRYFNEEIG
ncbi:unnamed protein product [Colias eurytheme]|nr:unnamed protein product [Colias eurytheme]